MDSAVINIKIEPRLKSQAQKVAEEFGLTLSTMVKSLLAQVVRRKEIVLSLSEEPTEYLLKALKESEADIKAGRVSPAFDNVSDATKWLNSDGKKYARPIRRKLS